MAQYSFFVIVVPLLVLQGSNHGIDHFGNLFEATSLPSKGERDEVKLRVGIGAAQFLNC